MWTIDDEFNSKSRFRASPNTTLSGNKTTRAQKAAEETS